MQRNRLRARQVVGALSIVVVAVLVGGSLASAHEHRNVDNDKYELIVGFLVEPSVQGELNGLDLTVQQPAAPGAAQATPASDEGAPGTPVSGADQTLKAEVTYGGQTKTLVLAPAEGAEGHYTAHFIPTASGTYTFHIFGTINGDPVDEKFTSGPNTFDDVAPRADVSFPSAVQADTASVAAQDAKDTADTARTLGIIGIVVGVLGLAAGAGGLMLARGARPAAASPTRPGQADDY